MLTLERNGLRLTGPERPKRNAYIRVAVKVVADMGRDRFDAWNDAVSFAYDVYGSVATEDGTIGQCSQLDGSDGSKSGLPVAGRVFSLGLNLYGKRAKDVQARIAVAMAA